MQSEPLNEAWGVFPSLKDDASQSRPVDNTSPQAIRGSSKMTYTKDNMPRPVASSRRMAYGGIVFKGDKILLRKPTNNYGRYAWTFAKGGIERGHSPEKTALKEVEEETGFICRITGKIPKTFNGTTGATEFYRMEPIKQGKFGWETEKIIWADFRTAKKLIEKTGTELGNTYGMKRDLDILHHAFHITPDYTTNAPEVNLLKWPAKDPHLNMDFKTFVKEPTR